MAGRAHARGEWSAGDIYVALGVALVAASPIVALILGRPTVAFVGLLVTVAMALAPSPRALPAQLPLALAILLAMGTAWGLLPVDHLASVLAVRVFVTAVAVGAVAVAWRRLRVPTVRSGLPRVVGLQVAVWLVSAVLTTAVNEDRRLGWFLNGDNVRHTVLTSWIVENDRLDYGQSDYPAAWHVVLGTFWRGAGGTITPSGLDSLLRLQAGASATAFIILVAGVGVVTLGLARRTGMARAQQALAVTLGSLLTCWPMFARFLSYGFQTSIVAQAVVLAIMAELLSTRRRWTAVAVACGVVALANSWQLLAPPGLIALAFVLIRHRKGNVGTAVTATLVAAALALPPVLAVATSRGLSGVTTDGDIDRPSFAWLLVALLAAAYLLVRDRDKATYAVVVVALVPLGEALAVCAIQGIPPTKYYPAKLIWASTVALVPMMAWAAVAYLTRILASERRVLRVGLLLALTTGVVASLSIASVASGAITSSDPRVVRALIHAPHAPEANVVWSDDDTYSDFTAALLLNFYHLDAITGVPPLPPKERDEQCRVLLSSPSPTILSDRPADEVRDRFSCVPTATIHRPG